MQPRNNAEYYADFQLSATQVKLLKRLANGKVKIYCMPAGLPRDRRCEEMNEQFNEVLQLVEMGLVNDVSDAEKFRPIVEESQHNEGRDLVVIWLNGFGQSMFERTAWEKRIN